ncbi:hypothetical protein [Legionella sp. W05-934-2]|uniref:hypothetical protein n=1 Tax=Legionella sp. W05-934-2 TaxID=1198649 RepID=UPI0034623594
MSDSNNSILKEALHAFLYDEIKTTYRFSSDKTKSDTIFDNNEDEIKKCLKQCLQELPAEITQVDFKEHKGFLNDLYGFLFSLSKPQKILGGISDLKFLMKRHIDFQDNTQDSLHLFNQRLISGCISFDIFRQIFGYIPLKKDNLGLAATCRHFNAFWKEQRQISQAKPVEESKSTCVGPG